MVEDMQNNNTSTKLRDALKNYLIIRMISIFENYLKILIKERIDEYDISPSELYQGEAAAPIKLLDNLISSQSRITKGLIIANDFKFANLQVINKVFTSY
jgi:hypothetical protein